MFWSIIFDTDCEHSYQGPMTRNLKVRPNFSQHMNIKNPDAVKNLRLHLKPFSSILLGIGHSFRNLEKLDLGESSNSGTLQFIERVDFSNLNKIKELGLNENKLEFIPEDVFWDLQNLEGLHMWNCRITKLPKKVFISMTKLKKLFLGENKISYLDKDLFRNNLLLERLNIFNNNLKLIDVDFTKLTRITWLSVFGNDCISERYIPTDKQHNTIASVQKLQEVVNEHCRNKTYHIVIV